MVTNISRERRDEMNSVNQAFPYGFFGRQCSVLRSAVSVGEVYGFRCDLMFVHFYNDFLCGLQFQTKKSYFCLGF